MSTQYNTAEFYVEDAIQKYLAESLRDKIPVLRGTELNATEYPVAFVQLMEAIEPEELHGTATMEVAVDVGVMTTVGSNRDEHVTRIGNVMDLIFEDDFITYLNAQVDFLVVQHVRRGVRRTSMDLDAGTRTTAQRLILLCSMNAT